MIINFDKIDEASIKNFNGGEKEFNPRISNDGLNKILKGRLVPGASIGVHTHETNSEILYVLEGTGEMIDDGEKFAVEPGICCYCPKGHSHSLINNGETDLIFFAVIPEQ